MDKLNTFIADHFALEISQEFKKKACYYSSLDHIEYLSVDAITISDRIDEFLTIIWNKNLDQIVGFKLKGFKAAFEKIKPLKLLKGTEFNPLIDVLEHAFTEIGNDIFRNIPDQDNRITAYKDVRNFIIEENVNLEENFSQAA